MTRAFPEIGRPGHWSDFPSRQRLFLGIGLTATAALLFAHALVYRFLTDDAFISFRYARNLADGAGLVFNPGYERVEGYTNFLWILILSIFAWAEVPLESAATLLSLCCTAGLWVSVAWFTLRQRCAGDWAPLALLPPALLAMTRSVAVWSTSGLETRLFELLIVAGVLRLIVETAALDVPCGKTRPFSALFLALATLTRPDGLLIFVAAFGSVGAARWRGWRERLSWFSRSTGLFAIVVGGHYLFRLFYYGAWLPNTYFAKFDGLRRWDTGFAYLGMFALEYAMYVWVPFLAAAVIYHRRRRTLLIPLVFASVICAHALYVAFVGGDHFEYRFLDLYLPFLYLLIGNGAMLLAQGRRSRLTVVPGLGLLMLGIVELPWRSHAEFPKYYSPGFPGGVLQGTIATNYYGPDVGRETAEGYLAPDHSIVFRLPILGAIARTHQSLLRQATAHFVAIRQEEHKLFLRTVVTEGAALRELVDQGLLPKDTYIAIDCVGAIPYLSNLRTLDRLGLTDAAVARTSFVEPGLMAHGKYASPEYARRRGVDLWAVDAVYLVWNIANPKFVAAVEYFERSGQEMHFAPVGGGNYLFVWLPQGAAAARSRFPRLHFGSTADNGAVRALMDEASRL